MDFAPQQQRALEEVGNWLHSGQNQVFRLFGYAGTGKTTLARHFADQVGSGVLFAAFTGKAALVLRQKGCHAASTIHRLIYQPRDKSKAHLANLQKQLAMETEDDRVRELRKLIELENENLKRVSFVLNMESNLRTAELLVIDEVSMVGKTIAEDLLSFGTRVLVLGDPAQLPPVRDGGYFTEDKPDVMLTDIHRQAEGSPVIQLATEVRQHGSLPGFGDFGDGSAHLLRSDLRHSNLLEYDQILVGRNKTRQNVNRHIRKQIGRDSHLPVEGDKLVCLKNNHDLGLLNGSLWIVRSCIVEDDDKVLLSLIDEEGVELSTLVHRHHFEDRVDEMAHWEKPQADEFDFGYALTVHKAQGSQWGRVLVVNEGHCFGSSSGQWLYTAITRASNSVVVAS